MYYPSMFENFRDYTQIILIILSIYHRVWILFYAIIKIISFKGVSFDSTSK